MRLHDAGKDEPDVDRQRHEREDPGVAAHAPSFRVVRTIVWFWKRHARHAGIQSGLERGTHHGLSSLTVAALLERQGLAGKRVAVERNGEIVPKSRHVSTQLEAGDRLEIVVAVGGG